MKKYADNEDSTLNKKNCVRDIMHTRSIWKFFFNNISYKILSSEIEI